jgi:hypothetical protein
MKESQGDLADLITDFTHTQDAIDLSAMDANVSLSGRQAFGWGGYGAKTAGMVTLQEVNGNTIVSASAIGDTGNELRIVLLGAGLNLQSSDFTL